MSFKNIRCICLFLIVIIFVIVIQIWRSQLPTKELESVGKGTLITVTSTLYKNTAN